MKGCLTNIVLTVFLGGMFYAYYVHISEKFIAQEQALVHKLKQADSKNQELAKMIALDNSSDSISLAKKEYNKMLLDEAKEAVELVGKKNLLSIKVVKNRLLLVVAPDVNLKPVRIRYGSQAFYKVSKDDIKIAISISYLIRSAKNKQQANNMEY